LVRVQDTPGYGDDMNIQNHIDMVGVYGVGVGVGLGLGLAVRVDAHNWTCASLSVKLCCCQPKLDNPHPICSTDNGVCSATEQQVAQH